MKPVIVLLLLLLSSSLWAQVDPSTSALLRSRGQESRQNDFDSNRYTVRPGPPSGPVPQAEEVKPPPSKKETQTETTPVRASAQSKTEAKAETSAKAEAKAQSDADLAEQMRDLLLGGPAGSIEEYRALLDRRDSRKNLLEVTVAPSYFYNDSHSSYWYRRYHSSGPAFHADAKVWISPFFGIQSSYFTSLGSEMRGNLAGTKYVPAEYELFDVGFRGRRFFGVSRKSPRLIFGIDYREYRLKVPADDDNRIRLRTSGVRLSAEMFIPKSSRTGWLFGVEFAPRSNHREVKTGIDVRSGTDNQTDMIGVWFGKRYLFDRKNQVYWKLSHSIEKSVFKGSANLADPVSGATPEGVSVTNGMTILELGYTWGD